MTKQSKIPKTTPEEIEKLANRLETSPQALSKEELDLAVRLLRTISYLVSLLQRKNISIKRLKGMLFGDKTEKYRPEGQSGEPKNESQNSNDSQKEEMKPGNETESEPKAKRKGHGRLPAKAFKVTQVVQLKHEQYNSGDNCPEEGCKGRLYDTQSPSILIQFEGHPPVTAVRYEQQILRCALCGRRFHASLPAEVKPYRYTASADAAIAIYKYGSVQPWYRQAMMQESFGVPLSESVQWERNKQTAEAGKPIYIELRRLCGNSELVHIDDTGVRILSWMEENNNGTDSKPPPTKRKGTYTSVLIGHTYDGYKIALYVSGSKQAGENLTEMLELRADNAPQLILECDALAANTKGVNNTIVSLCLAHGRRKFYELKDYHPEECKYVLDLIGKVYKIEDQTKTMSKQERLIHHQKYSRPIMDELKSWLDKQVWENLVEPNSVLGSAIFYMRKHWDGLTKWLTVAGAPIDNNAAERGVKRFILFRKNSLFYKNNNGVNVGNILLSVIETCRLNKVNPMEYLEYVINNSEEVNKTPEKNLPWNYKDNCVEAISA